MRAKAVIPLLYSAKLASPSEADPWPYPTFESSPRISEIEVRKPKRFDVSALKIFIGHLVLAAKPRLLRGRPPPERNCGRAGQLHGFFGERFPLVPVTCERYI